MYTWPPPTLNESGNLQTSLLSLLLCKHHSSTHGDVSDVQQRVRIVTELHLQCTHKKTNLEREWHCTAHVWQYTCMAVAHEHSTCTTIVLPFTKSQYSMQRYMHTHVHVQCTWHHMCTVNYSHMQGENWSTRHPLPKSPYRVKVVNNSQHWLLWAYLQFLSAPGYKASPQRRELVFSFRKWAAGKQTHTVHYQV